MKRSQAVPLVMIGTVIAVTGCGPSVETSVVQRSYTSLADCKKDWDENQCSPQTYTSGSGYSGGYYGPRYYWDRDAGKPMAVATDGTVTEISNAHVRSEYGFSGSSAFRIMVRSSACCCGVMARISKERRKAARRATIASADGTGRPRPSAAG